MKLSAAVVATLAAASFLSASQAFSQQATGSPLPGQIGSSVASPTASQQSLSSAAVSAGGTTRLRITGTPANQPAPGLGVECTPVEQEIVGVIIGPTDLCDR